MSRLEPGRQVPAERPVEQGEQDRRAVEQVEEGELVARRDVVPQGLPVELHARSR